MIAPVLIFAVGNESRGDDALAPLLLRELAGWLSGSGGSEQFELLEEFQLQVEHAMDMKERRLVLFIDAGMETPAPFSFYRAQMSHEPVLYSHALEPQALLKVYEQFYNEPAPDAFILCIRGESFELGEALSAQASQHLASARDFIRQLMLESEMDIWESRCTQNKADEPMGREDDCQETARC